MSKRLVFECFVVNKFKIKKREKYEK